MDIFSLKFLGILALAVIILTLRAKRKKQGPSIVHGKQIPIRGQKISTFLSRDTPLKCLLDDDKSFGDDFKDKTPPTLPHETGCQCEMKPVIHRSHDWFNSKVKQTEKFVTDLGELDRNEFRFFKFKLIVEHKEVNEELKEQYQDLLENISVSEDFKSRIAKYVAMKS